MPDFSSSSTLQSGLVCVVTLARYHGIAISTEQLQHDHAVAGEWLSTCALLQIFQQLSLKAKYRKVAATRLQHTPLPAIARDVRAGRGDDR